MNSESHQRSVPLTNPVDPSIIRVLGLLDPIARSADCQYFVAGATARDLILVNVHGLPPGRATRDIDLGIAVQSWDEFALLKQRLTATRGFEAVRRTEQRLIYSDQAAGFSIPLDLIPFRGVASDEGTIAWPPRRDIVMNVAGFEEALGSAVLVEVEEGLAVRVTSVPGLALLKLVAWTDRGRETTKDAADLYRLLTAYADAGNVDRLYDQEMDLLEAVGFDVQLAGAELLGRDVAGICSMPVLEQFRSLAASERNIERLVSQIVQAASYAEMRPTVERALEGFLTGLVGVK